MFIERLKDEEILEFIKLQIENGLVNTKAFYLNNNEFDFLKKQKYFQKEIIKSYKNYENIYIMSTNFFERHKYKEGDSRALLEIEIFQFYKKESFITKRTKYHKCIYRNRYSIGDFHFSFDIYCNIDYYKFMYKKFGEEYLVELKKELQREKDSHMKLLKDNHDYILNSLEKQ